MVDLFSIIRKVSVSGRLWLGILIFHKWVMPWVWSLLRFKIKTLSVSRFVRIFHNGVIYHNDAQVTGQTIIEARPQRCKCQWLWVIKLYIQSRRLIFYETVVGILSRWMSHRGAGARTKSLLIRCGSDWFWRDWFWHDWLLIRRLKNVGNEFGWCCCSYKCYILAMIKGLYNY